MWRADGSSGYIARAAMDQVRYGRLRDVFPWATLSRDIQKQSELRWVQTMALLPSASCERQSPGRGPQNPNRQEID